MQSIMPCFSGSAIIEYFIILTFNSNNVSYGFYHIQSYIYHIYKRTKHTYPIYSGIITVSKQCTLCPMEIMKALVNNY